MPELISKAIKVHYDPGDNRPLCETKHGHQVTTTKTTDLVTCKICLFHLGLHTPENYTPAPSLQRRAESRIMRFKQARIQRLIAQRAGTQLTMF